MLHFQQQRLMGQELLVFPTPLQSSMKIQVILAIR